MDYRQLNDYEVISMIREDDEDSRNIMYQKYLPVIKKCASKYLDGVKRHGIEFDDLVQEGWLALESAICSYKESYDVLFYTFAKVCIESHIHSFCKRLETRKNYVLDNALYDEDFSVIADNSMAPEAFLRERIAEEDFKNFKNLFDIKDSVVFELRYNGFSYNEISRLLDIPISTIDGRMYKIRKILQAKYKISC